MLVVKTKEIFLLNLHQNRVHFPAERNAFVLDHQHGRHDVTCKPAIAMYGFCRPFKMHFALLVLRFSMGLDIFRYKVKEKKKLYYYRVALYNPVIHRSLSVVNKNSMPMSYFHA